MRQIKFRAWDIKNNRMIYFDRIDFRCEYNCLEFGCDWNKYDFGYGDLQLDINDDPVMQFTGLQDKNGKDIYEGDIVEMRIRWAEYKGQDEDEMPVRYQKGRVVFDSGCFWIDSPLVSINCHFHYNNSDREVIGNIYETPDVKD